MTKPTAKMPMRSTKGSAGYDLFASEDLVLEKRAVTSIQLPFTFKGSLHESIAAFVVLRSSSGIKKKMRLVLDGKKTIEGIQLNVTDPVHTIAILNDSDTTIIIPKDEHYAQIVFSTPFETPQPLSIERVKEEVNQQSPPIAASIFEYAPNVYDYVIDETVVLQPNEQKTFPTGLKARITDGTWLAIRVHDDIKELVMLANQLVVGDADYYENSGNDGNYHLAIVNLTDEVCILPAGTHVARWWSEKFYVLENEIAATKERVGGIGSTN